VQNDKPKSGALVIDGRPLSEFLPPRQQGVGHKGIAREAQRYELTGVPTSTWYDLQNAGLAPKPIHLGPRSVGWLISELEEWVEARKAERDRKPAMTIDELVETFATINDRAELIALLAPLRLPHGVSEHDKARVGEALTAAAARCWKGRVSG
jgi:prophage regulatory protein